MSGLDGISGTKLDHLSLEALQAPTPDPALAGGTEAEPAGDLPARDGRRMQASGMAHQLATMARLLEAEDLAKAKDAGGADGGGALAKAPVSSFVTSSHASAGPDAKAGSALAAKLAKATPADIGKKLGSDVGSLMNVGEAIRAGKVKDVNVIAGYLNASKLPMEQQRVLEKLDPKTFEAVTKAVRAGTIGNDSAIASVGIEMAARSKWGKDNPKVVEKLHETNNREGGIRFGLPEGLGATSGAKTQSIQLSDELKRNPVALAAILAHEGTHVHQGATCACSDASANAAEPAQEVAGNIAGAKVWTDLQGDKQDTGLPATIRGQLNEYAAELKVGEPAVRGHVAAAYLAAADAKINERVLKKVPETKDDTAKNWVFRADMLIKTLVGDADGQKNLTADQAKRVANAGLTAAGQMEDPATMAWYTGKALLNAPEASKSAALEAAKKFLGSKPGAAEALQAFKDGLEGKSAPVRD